MKIIKSLSTLLIAMGVVLGTSAFAANSIQFSEPKYDGSADTISISISVADAVDSVGADGYIAVYFSEDDFSYASADCATNVYVDSYSDSFELAFDDDVDTSANKVLATVTLNVIGDKAAVVGTEFETDYIMYVPEKEKVTGALACKVASAGPTGPTATKGETAANGITEYTVANDEDLADKKVMMSPKFENQTITEATRFVVTWNGIERKFGSDLYAKLGGQGVDIQIGSLTFGLIVDDANAKASDFTFAIN